MKRWNGWGDENTDYPVPPDALAYLQEVVGKPEGFTDVTLEETIQKVPKSKLKHHPLITTDAEARIRHARGQSMNDWIDMREGLLDTFPDGVAYPKNDQEVRELIQFCAETKAHIIPYGGGSSVVGHLTPLKSDRPILSIDLAKMDQLLDLNETDMQATIGAGARGPRVEEQLNPLGYTLGHFPQSWEYSTLGGWIVTRGVGQQSYHYGRIEPLFVGGHLETPSGSMDIPLFPMSAAGPDLRHLVLGSEARLGIITQATMRIRKLPEREKFSAAFFPNWRTALAAIKEIAQKQVPVCMARLSDPLETEANLQLAGKKSLTDALKKLVSVFGQKDERCMFIFGVTGSKALTRLAERQVAHITRKHHGMVFDYYLGHSWQKNRFHNPYLRNTLWELGYGIDTLETALPWSKIAPCDEAILNDIRHGLEDVGEKVLVFSHVSHVYTNGGSLYISYLFGRSADPKENLRRWVKLKTMASERIVQFGGTISHQHGVGLDHKAFLAPEKGEMGMALIREAINKVDPQGIFNPGKLID